MDCDDVVALSHRLDVDFFRCVTNPAQGPYRNGPEMRPMCWVCRPCQDLLGWYVLRLATSSPSSVALSYYNWPWLFVCVASNLVLCCPWFWFQPVATWFSVVGGLRFRCKHSGPDDLHLSNSDGSAKYIHLNDTYVYLYTFLRPWVCPNFTSDTRKEEVRVVWDVLHASSYFQLMRNSYSNIVSFATFKQLA